jgi:release factor glutamine methyltransferase
MKTGGRTATLRQSLSISRAVLRDGGVAEWEVEAEALLRHVLETNRADFLTLVYAKDGILNHSQAKYLSSLLDLRLSGEPLAYIVGRREFYGLELEVNEHVLIPRQETELLVDIVLEYLPSFEPTPRVVDVGTGSGAVALAIAANSKSVDIIATDNSGGALDVVRRNASKLGLSNRISFVRCDMLDAVGGPVDIIVSNPPYIPSGQIEYLQTEVRREPVVALDGGDDGLEPFRRLLAQAEDKLAPGGVVVVELMPEQMEAAMEIARQTMPNLSAVRTREDLMGNARALVLET